jgi:hypothetical protein
MELIESGGDAQQPVQGDMPFMLEQLERRQGDTGASGQLGLSPSTR